LILEKNGKYFIDLIKILRVTSALDPDPLDSQDLGFLDPDPQKYADPRIRIQGNQPKTEKNFLLLKPKSELLKKRDYKNFLISEWFIKFLDKNKRKK